MKTRRITDRAEFDALAPVWASVAAESGQTSPFHSHDWFACCWNVAIPDRQPEVLVVEDAAGPVGLVPLVRTEKKARAGRFSDRPESPV